MKKNSTLRVYFDGDCWFCKNYIALTKLKKLGVNVDLINLRDHTLPNNIPDNLNVDKGMVVTHAGNLYFGDEAIRYISELTEEESLTSKTLKVMFKNKKIAIFFYTIFRLVRLSYLILTSKLGINNQAKKQLRYSLLKFLKISVYAQIILIFAILTEIYILLRYSTFASYFNIFGYMSIILGYFYLQETLWHSKRNALKCFQLLRSKWVMLASVILILTPFIFEGYFSRRIALFALTLPLFIFVAERFLKYARHFSKYAKWCFVIIGFASIYPGLMVGMFYDGIPGWTYQLKSVPQKITIDEYQLVTEANEKKNVSFELYHPVTHNFRFLQAMDLATRKHKEPYDTVFSVVKAVLCHRVETDNDNKLSIPRPSRRFLKTIYYPSHTHAVWPDYNSKFLADVTKLEKVYITRDLTSGNMSRVVKISEPFSFKDCNIQ